MSRGLSIMPRGRLVLILIGLLINSIIFSSAFTFFASISDFSGNFLGEGEETFVIFNQAANTVFTGTVPTYLAYLVEEIPGVQVSPEVLVAALSVDGEILTLRGVSENFLELESLDTVDGELTLSMGECLVGFRAFKSLSREIGQYLTLRSTQSEVIHDFMIIGVYRSNTPLDDEVIVQIDSARAMSGLPLESSTLIRVKIDESLISQETLSSLITDTHSLMVNVVSESSFNTRLEVRTESGRLIETRDLSAPGELMLELPFGRYILGVEGLERLVTLDGNKTIEFMIQRDMHNVVFNVYSATTGEGIEADIQIEGIANNNTTSIHTLGVSTIQLPSGEYRVRTMSLGFMDDRVVSVSGDLEVDVRLGLIPLTVMVIDEHSEPVNGVDVLVEGEEIILSRPTDELGLAFFGLESGSYKATVMYENNSKSRSLNHDQEQTLIFTLGETLQYDLTLRVSWSNGTRVNEAEVILKSGDFLWAGTTNRDGEAVINNLPEGLLQVSAEKNGKIILREIMLDGDRVLEIELPVSISFDQYEISPEWVRYLPQSVTVTLSDVVLQNAMKMLVNLITSTMFILAALFTTATVINSLDIIQNSVNESSHSLGILRSVGASKYESFRILGVRVILSSVFVGLLGYVIGYLLLTLSSQSGFLSLAGYVLEPKLNYVILASSIILCLLVTVIGFYRQLGSLFRYSPMTLLKGLRKSDILYLPRRIKHPVAAFTVPLLIRAIPEILVGPLNIGYDTISSYIPALVALQTGFESQVYDFLYQRPFFWVVASLPYPFDDLSPFKFLPVILHGLLGLSIYIYAEEINGDKIKALAIALLSTLYFISLRISWDLFGNEMGLILVFISLTLLRRGPDTWSSKLLSFLVVTATVLTHEAASMILFAASIPEIIDAVKTKKYRNAFNLLLVLGPTLLFFIYRLQVLDFPLISNPASFRYPSQTYDNLFKSVYTMYLYIILPLIPLALFGLYSDKKSMSMVYWFCGVSAAALSPLVSPDAAITFWDRWAYMTVYPLCFYAVEGIYLLRRYKITINVGPPRSADLGKVAGGVLAIVVLIISSSFLVAAPGNFQPYHTLFGSESLWIVRFVPSSMLLSTVPPSMAEEAIAGVEWLNDNLTEVSVLFIDEELRGYAALYIDRDKVLLRDLGVPWYSNPNYIVDASIAAEEYFRLGYDVYLLSRHFTIEGYETVYEAEYLRVSKYRDTGI